MANDLIRDPVAFIDRYLPLNEKGKPWGLSRHQRRVLAAAFRWDTNGRLRIRTFVWGEMKKSGKTFLAACLVLWWGFVTSDTEIKIAANDLEQSVGRVFLTVVKLLEHNHQLGLSAKIRASDIVLTNGTTISAIASDYKGAAGSRHSLVVFDELWGYSHEAAQRLFEELTPPPTEENAWLLIVTYAGWIGESVLLERLYKQGLAGERIDDELEVYIADELFMFWSHTPRQPWQTDQYYAEQRRSLRPNTFARIHENRWVTGESSFITPELWDACVAPDHLPIIMTDGPSLRDRVVVAGVDASVKGDHTAAVVVENHGGTVRLLAHRIWKPTANMPMDFEATVERFIMDLHARFLVQAVYFDPYQFHRSATTLQLAGVPMREFPQSVANTVRMGQVLYDLIQRRVLVVYPSAELRQQGLNAVAVETPRGFRIAKEKASRKIDAIVALSMACCAALDYPQLPSLDLLSGRVQALSVDEIQRLADEEHAQRRKEGAVWLKAKIEAGDGVYFPGD